MEENVIYVIESQDYIFIADTLEKAEEIADRLAMDYTLQKKQLML